MEPRKTTIVREDPARSGRELVISRLLNAPRTLVWEAWTNPKHLINWFGPNGFTNTFHEINIKPGGVWRFIMHGPDGTDYPNKVIFKDVRKPSHLSYRHGDDTEDGLAFEVTVDFEEKGEKTQLTMRMAFASAEQLDKVIKENGALEGAIQTMDRLEEELIKMAD